jgi:hypothetical protein
MNCNRVPDRRPASADFWRGSMLPLAIHRQNVSQKRRFLNASITIRKDFPFFYTCDRAQDKISAFSYQIAGGTWA